MKIAFLSSSASPNHGWGNITLCLCDFFYKNNVDFDLFLPDDHDKFSADWDTHVKYSLPKNAVDFKSKRSLFLPFKDVSFLKGYDVIHVLDGYAFSLLALKASNLYGSKLIQGIQGTYGLIPFDEKLSGYLFKKILKKCTFFVGPSHFSTEEVHKRCPKLDLAKKIEIIPNGVNFERFQISQTETSANFDFVGIGEIKPRKGFDLVIRALPEVLKKYPTVKYKIIGPGNHSDLSKICQELKIEKSIIFMGVKSGVELVSEIHNSFAYIHAPRNIDNNFEGFGIVYIEANACGIPSLGSRSGGVPDAIVHEKTGLLFAENSIEEITASMLRIIEDRRFYESLKENCLNWAQEHDWEKIGHKYLELYRKTLI